MLNAFRFILLLSVVIWVGSLIFFTAFAAPSIFKALPREMAGEVVSRIFPKYWAIGYVAGILSLASLLAISFIEKGFPVVRVLLLALMTTLTFYSGLVITPQAQAVKAQMKVVEEPAKVEALRNDFRQIHMKSYALNVLVIVAGVAFVFFTSRNMRL